MLTTFNSTFSESESSERLIFQLGFGIFNQFQREAEWLVQYGFVQSLASSTTTWLCIKQRRWNLKMLTLATAAGLIFLFLFFFLGAANKLASGDDNVEIDFSLWEKSLWIFSVNNGPIRWRLKPLFFTNFLQNPKKYHGTKNNHPQMLEGRGADIHQAHCHGASHPSKDPKHPQN